MKNTDNYGLRKPDADDFVNISDLNENFDIIDSRIGAPEYEYSDSEKELVSGEKLPTALSKIALAMRSFFTFKKNMSNVENKSSATIRGELTKKNVTDALGYTPPSTDTTYSAATQSANGLMSAADKKKLDGVAAGAQVNTMTGVKGDGETNYRTGNVNITKGNIGLGNVENKSSATIRGELTKKNVTDALGYTPPTSDTNTTYNFAGTTFNSGNSGTAEHDANKMTANGIYYYTSNGPSTSIGASTNDGAMIVQAYSESWIAQLALDYRNGNLFRRGRNNGTWTDWKKVPESDTNTWRGIVNSLTSTSTSDSLSANQGRLLANGSARDSTKLSKEGDTLYGVLTLSGHSSPTAKIMPSAAGYHYIGERTTPFGTGAFQYLYSNYLYKLSGTPFSLSDFLGPSSTWEGNSGRPPVALDSSYSAPAGYSPGIGMSSGGNLFIMGRGSEQYYSWGSIAGYGAIGLAIGQCFGAIAPAASFNGAPTVSNQGLCSLGTTGAYFNEVYAAAYRTASDRRKKTDIEEVSDRYEKLFDEIQFVSFRWKNNHNTARLASKPSRRKHIGFIAQDIQSLLRSEGISGEELSIVECEWFLGNITDAYITGGYQKPYYDEEKNIQYSYDYNTWKYKHDMEYDVYNEILETPVSRLLKADYDGRSLIHYIVFEDNSNVRADGKQPPIKINSISMADKDGNIMPLEFDISDSVPYYTEDDADFSNPLTIVTEDEDGAIVFNTVDEGTNNEENFKHFIGIKNDFDILDPKWDKVVVDADYIGEYKIYLMPGTDIKTANIVYDIDRVDDQSIYDYALDYNSIQLICISALQTKSRRYEKKMKEYDEKISSLEERLERLEAKS